jgi:hypothetical protein
MSGAAFFDLYTDPPPTETALLGPVELAASGDVECWHPVDDPDDELRARDNHGLK